MIIDATNLVVGRLGSVVAKRARLGEKVDIVNCEKAVITGSRTIILGRYKHAYERGDPFHGPFFPAQPDKFVRRVIRGMVERRTPRGREAFKRIMCFKGVPPEFEGKDLQTLTKAKITAKTVNYLTIQEITDQIKKKKEY